MHLLLQSRLGLAGGLADPGVRLLDPAAGSMNFIRAAWRIVLESACPGMSHFTGIELLPDLHTRGRATLRRFLNVIGCDAGPARISTVNADALAPPPEILDHSFNVIVGNPPWRGRSSHHGRWMADLLRDYFRMDGPREGNPKWLQDDYVKFLRLAQWLIERQSDQSGGIVAFVLNHNFLEAPTFRGLRQSLLTAFQEIYALDLHGNARRRESGNVFRGVAQGVAVLFLVRKPGLPPRVLRADLHGSRREKLATLGRTDVLTTAWTPVSPRPPAFLLIRGDRAVEREYERGISIPDIFPVHGAGLVTGRDAERTALDRDTLRARFGEEHGKAILPFLARPFDLRFVLYQKEFLARPRSALMSHLLDGAKGGNIGLIVPRQTKEEPGALVTRWIAGHKVVSAHDVCSLFPLYLGRGPERRPNLAPGLAGRLGGLLGDEPPPEAIQCYVYAVLYSPPYRKRYRELLRRSFPRIPLPPDCGRFAVLAALGGELIALHLLQDVRLHRAWSRGCEEIEPDLLDYRIGAYPVLRQWLQARRNRILSREDSRHFQQVVEALRLTRDVQAKIADVPMG
ncbi:MAG TPA: type ISP restriction/modification enzyme [Thermoanaerobaculia bacterium]|nr:type ISP restriction/modification enzyme [Thermoanaerobaculia bacterium]